MRAGLGYDIHALKAGRRLVLGGVQIPFKKGLFGHSDADVVFHAIIDALLGASGLGDIGEHFSDKDPRFKGADSGLFARQITALLRKKGFKIINIDVTLVAEAPKLSPYKARIRESIAKHFGVKTTQVGFKAKTNEGFGAIGKNQAMACLCVVSIKGKK